MGMRRDAAETFAIAALGWLAEAELVDAFLAATGTDAADLRGAAGDPAFLGAVLDFVAQSDDWVRACCAAQGRPPEALMVARAALPGGDQPHWT